MAIVMVVESSEQSRRRLGRILMSDGLEVVETASALDALRGAFRQPPQAAVVDLTTPDMDGLELVRILRGACDIPIVVVARSREPQEVVRSLDAGADDVVDAACTPVELLARLHGAMRRYGKREPQTRAQARITTGSLLIDLGAQTVQKRGQLVPLTRTEHRLLNALAVRIGETVSHRDLLTEAWGYEYSNDTQYLRLYVGYLRAKLEDMPARPSYILNEWGVGYRLARLPIEQAIEEPERVLANVG